MIAEIKDRIEIGIDKQKFTKKKILVSSIEAKKNHKLYEFTENVVCFDVVEIDFRKGQERIYVNIDGEFVLQKPKSEIVKIDIFNPDFKAKKKSIDIDFKEGSCYITALNYKNACRKMKITNETYFK
jgi:hypothetical protein